MKTNEAKKPKFKLPKFFLFLAIILVLLVMITAMASNVFAASIIPEKTRYLENVGDHFNVRFTIDNTGNSSDETILVDILSADSDLDFDDEHDEVTVPANSARQYNLGLKAKDDGEMNFNVKFFGPRTNQTFTIVVEAFDKKKGFDFSRSEIYICRDEEDYDLEVDDLQGLRSVDIDIKDNILNVDIDNSRNVDEGDDITLQFDVELMKRVPAGRYRLEFEAKKDNIKLKGYVYVNLQDCYRNSSNAPYDNYYYNYLGGYDFYNNPYNYNNYYGYNDYSSYSPYSNNYFSSGTNYGYSSYGYSANDLLLNLPSILQAQEGKRTDFTIDVQNASQRAQVITLSSDFELVSFETNEFLLGPGQRRLVRAFVLAPSEIGTGTITIQARSDLGNFKSRNITLVTQGISSLELTIEKNSQQFSKASMFNLPVKIKSRLANPKNFSISAFGTQGVVVSPSNTQVFLSPNEEKTINFTINIPAGISASSASVNISSEGITRAYAFTISGEREASGNIKIISIPDSLSSKTNSVNLNFTILNSNNKDSENYNIKIAEGDVVIVGLDGTLEAGQTKSFEVPLQLSSGTHSLKLKMDNNGAITEKNISINVQGFDLAGLFALGGGNAAIAIAILIIGLLIVYFATGKGNPLASGVSLKSAGSDEALMGRL